MTTAQLAQLLGAQLAGSGTELIEGVGAVESASERQLTFVTDARHAAKVVSSAAGAVITSRRIDGLPMPQLIVKDVDVALIAALHAFAPVLALPAAGVHPTACVAPDVVLGEDISIGSHALVASGASVGDKTVIAAGVSIGQNSVIGKGCRIDANVVVYHNCVLGSKVWIQANSTIGSTGFGYKFIDGQHTLIPHNGGVIIEDCVDIGANCCIDRAKFGNTIIGAGTKIDNLVQIAHNVVVGKCCLIAAQVGIAGSCTLGNGVVIGGQVGLRDHISVGDGTMIGACAAVMNDVPAGQVIGGIPATEMRQQLRQLALISKLPQMAEQLKTLTKRIEAVGSTKNDKK